MSPSVIRRNSKSRIVAVIAMNTFREIMRDRILYGIVVFALLLIGLSIALGALSFAEQARISADFGFAGIQLSAVVLAIFAGSSLVAREIEKQTILTLLAKPVSRTQFLLGKFVGLASVVIVVMSGLGVVLALLLVYLGFDLQISFVWALLGILTEALILISAALLFGSFAKPMMTVVYVLAIFLIGHWLDSLNFFMNKGSTSASFKMVAFVLTNLLPNLEKLNWRSAPVYGTILPAESVVLSVAYGLGWIVILLSITGLVFRRRDFV